MFYERASPSAKMEELFAKLDFSRGAFTGAKMSDGLNRYWT